MVIGYSHMEGDKSVSLGGEVLGRGTGSSKKLAERLAAVAALEVLAARSGDDPGA